MAERATVEANKDRHLLSGIRGRDRVITSGAAERGMLRR
jgi:hypothetical protein